MELKLFSLIQIGKVCQIVGIHDDQKTCSIDSVLMSLHLTLVSQLLKVRLSVYNDVLIA